MLRRPPRYLKLLREPKIHTDTYQSAPARAPYPYISSEAPVEKGAVLQALEKLSVHKTIQTEFFGTTVFQLEPTHYTRKSEYPQCNLSFFQSVIHQNLVYEVLDGRS